MPNIHPLLVHFPIALIFAVIAIDLIGLLTRREAYLRVGTIVTVLALAGAIAAVTTGLLAEETVWHSEAAEELIERHELMGFVYLGVLAVLAIIRLAAGSRLGGRFGWVGLAVAVVAAGVVSYGAYLGGEMVYRHGTGVAGAQGQFLGAESDEEQGLDDEDEEEEEDEESDESE